ncbi:putative ribonuclease H-like domain-containing protein [Tanacetum coccineum]|uniref:Ribonuclease H-like domain-containing protein n=1 Tax=Tanacetum coccineum TaxID=301880 RepID=A0ABQ5H438_9ASTR
MELISTFLAVSQMYDKKNYVLFTDTECIVLSPDFKLPDESQILLKIPRKDNMYSFDMKNIVPKDSLTCLVAKATPDESMLWHRRLSHINFKNINKLVKDNLVQSQMNLQEHKKNLMQVEDGPHNESDEKDKSEDDSSPKEVNAAEQHVNITSPEVNTSRFKLNTVDPSVNTASSYELDCPKDMFRLGGSHTLETTHVEFFSDEDEPEVDLGNITNSYTVPTTPNTRIHKDHPIKNVIGDVKLNLQALLKLYLIHLGWKQCRKNYCNSSSNRQEEGVDYEEVFAPVARIKAIRLFLAYASFMGFLVYQMDVKSAFLYGTIKEEVYIDDIIFGSTNKELCIAIEKLMKDKFQMSSMGELTFFLGLQVKQKEDGIFISQDKYVAEIFKKFNYTDVKSASTPVDLEKPLSKMEMDSPFELVAYTDSDYAGATQHRKSTTGGCQFLGNRLISWQCKKQNVVATSTTEAEYVAAASYHGHDTKILQSSGPLVKVGDKAVHKKLGDIMERAATTASSLEAEQDSDAQTRFETTEVKTSGVGRTV